MNWQAEEACQYEIDRQRSGPSQIVLVCTSCGRRVRECPACRGEGDDQWGDECRRCDGWGVVDLIDQEA